MRGVQALGVDGDRRHRGRGIGYCGCVHVFLEERVAHGDGCSFYFLDIEGFEHDSFSIGLLRCPDLYKRLTIWTHF